MTHFMGRDYVTLRGEERDGETVWIEDSVGRAQLKSAPVRVIHSEDGYRIEGAAWGAPIGAGGGADRRWRMARGADRYDQSGPLCLEVLDAGVAGRRGRRAYRSPRVRRTPTVMSSRPWTTRGSRIRSPIGRATDRSRGGSRSRRKGCLDGSMRGLDPSRKRDRTMHWIG